MKKSLILIIVLIVAFGGYVFFDNKKKVEQYLKENISLDERKAEENHNLLNEEDKEVENIEKKLENNTSTKIEDLEKDANTLDLEKDLENLDNLDVELDNLL